MKELFQAINRSDHFLVGDADVSLLSSGFGFIGDFKAGRQGVALKPDAFDGDSRLQDAVPEGQAHRRPRGPRRSSCRTGGSRPCSCPAPRHPCSADAPRTTRAGTRAPVRAGAWGPLPIPGRATPSIS